MVTSKPIELNPKNAEDDDAKTPPDEHKMRELVSNGAQINATEDDTQTEKQLVIVQKMDGNADFDNQKEDTTQKVLLEQNVG